MMAGYITKPVSYAYEGEHAVAAETANGVILELDSTGKVLAAATDATAKFVCVEATTIYDAVPAYRFIVNKLGDNLLYFAENLTDVLTCEGYNVSEYTIPADALCRCHPLQIGDEFVTSVVTGTPVVGTAYGVTAGAIA